MVAVASKDSRIGQQNLEQNRDDYDSEYEARLARDAKPNTRGAVQAVMLIHGC